MPTDSNDGRTAETEQLTARTQDKAKLYQMRFFRGMNFL